MIANWFISFLRCGNFIRESFWATKYRQIWYDYAYHETDHLKFRKSLAKKLSFEKKRPNLHQLRHLSNHNNLFLVSAGVLMIPSVFVRLFSIRNTFRVANKLEIFSRDFRQGIILPSNIIPGVQLKFYCRKRLQEYS